MQFLSIGVSEQDSDIIDHMRSQLKLLKNKHIDCSIDEVSCNGSKSIICTIDDGKPEISKHPHSLECLRVHIANALADYIIKQYEEKLLARIINSNYCYFNAAERKEILAHAIRIVRNEDKNFLNSLFQMRRRNVIIRKLLDYFEGSNSLILDGFVNFRLKEYIKELEEVVDKAVDDFLMDREYREFIKLLRYFVDIQEPKFNVVHVTPHHEGKYVLMDENRTEITNECIQEFVNEIAGGEVNFDDLLVSSLITLSPRRIIIHGTDTFRNKELLETIKNVFAGKIVICSGCELCSGKT